MIIKKKILLSQTPNYNYSSQKELSATGEEADISRFSRGDSIPSALDQYNRKDSGLGPSIAGGINIGDFSRFDSSKIGGGSTGAFNDFNRDDSYKLGSIGANY